MYKSFSSLAAVVLTFGLLTASSYAVGEYSFDGGGDGTSWDDPLNWAITTNPDDSPGDGSNPGTPPNPIIAARIPMTGVVVDSTMPGMTAQDVHVGNAAGTGSLLVSGGSLASSDDIEIGVASSVGSMTISGGAVSLADDFNIFTNGSLHMTGGTLHIVDRLQMSGNGSMVMDGGTVTAEDDFYILDTSTLTINGGLMSTIDKLNNGPATPLGPPRLTINGGIMRSNEWTDNPDLAANDPTRITSIIEINGSGKLQIEQAQFPIAEAWGWISSGNLITSAPSPYSLGVTTVIVPEYFGRTDVVFTQISVVPEPASALLLGLGAVALLLRRKRA